MVLDGQGEGGELQDVRADLEAHGIDDRQAILLLQVGDELVLRQESEAHEMGGENAALMLLLGGCLDQLILADQRALDEEFTETGHRGPTDRLTDAKERSQIAAALSPLRTAERGDSTSSRTGTRLSRPSGTSS